MSKSKKSINELIKECLDAGYDEALTVRYVQARVSSSKVSIKKIVHEALMKKHPQMSEATLREKAAIEDTSLLSVGGLVSKLEQAEPKVPVFDVLIYEISTRKIDAIIGKDMPLHDGTGTGRNTADLRKQTGQERVNDRFDVAIVPAGKYKQVNERFKSNKFEPSLLDLKDEV